MLTENQIARLRKRAADPKTRTDASVAFSDSLQNSEFPGPKPVRLSMEEANGEGKFGGLVELVAGVLSSGRKFDPQQIAEQIAEDVRTGKTSVDEVFGGIQPGAGIEVYADDGSTYPPQGLPPRATPSDIAAVEATLGFPLPDDLKQLYTSVANGGFGPGAGFRSLAEIGDRYQECRSEPQGPSDETWPQNLLPVVPIEFGETCYDLTKGKIVCWDMEELVDADMEADTWERSFKPWADSLGDWLEAWLSQQPMSEQLVSLQEAERLEIARSSIEFLRNTTPEERSEMGLPRDGWEEQVCRNHGADPSKIL